jgi:S-adenosylmethionine hydrolase
MKKPRLFFSDAALFLVLAAWVLIPGCKNEDATQSKGPDLIAIVSDYGARDGALGELKGSIFSVHAKATVADLAIDLEPFNTLQAAYVTSQASRELPAGSVVVAAVAPNQTPVTAPVLLQTESGKFYVGPDNGVFTFILMREKLLRAWKLDKPEFYRNQQPSAGFAGRDVLGPIAAYLVAGNDPAAVGTPVKKADLQLLPITAASVSGPNIMGQIVHIDNFGNLVTNIFSDQATMLKEGNLVRITIGNDAVSGPLVKSFADLPKGRVGLVYNSQNLLQICVLQGSAARQTGAKIGATVIVRQ